MIRLAAIAWALAAAGPLWALELRLPSNARVTTEQVTSPDSYALPTGPFELTSVPTLTVEGAVSRQAWRIEGPRLTTLQLLSPLKAQLEAEGFEILLECDAPGCGGFDFRFGTEVLPAPAMFVSLTDFRFLSAVRRGGDQKAEVVSVLVSTTRSDGFIQIIRVADPSAPKVQIAAGSGAAVSADPAMTVAPDIALPLAEALDQRGHVVLDDLVFETGTTTLGAGPYASLSELAAYMAANPSRQIMLVGHTDSTGSLDANRRISRARAQSVLDRLVERHGTDPGRLSAAGTGYLAPRASNLTPEGREANRRVEAVLISTE